MAAPHIDVSYSPSNSVTEDTENGPLSPSVRDRPPTPHAHRSVRRVVNATSIATADNPAGRHGPPTPPPEGSSSTTWVRSASTKIMRGLRLRRERSKKRAKSVDIDRSPSPKLWKRLSLRKSTVNRQHNLARATASLALEDNENGDCAQTAAASPRRLDRFNSWRKSLSLRRRSRNPRLAPAPPTPVAGLRVRFQRASSLD
uniref:Uncharacterized protein n=1 Tax=Plectus sambesii TaxID=2011161 RepID=A0A914X7N0_9BILA